MAIAMLGVAVGAIKLYLFSVSPLGEGAGKAIVEVRRGIGPQELSKLLVQNGVLDEGQRTSFIWLGRLTRQFGKLKAGEYELRATQTPLEVFQVLESGISVGIPVTVKEGENIYEIAETLETRKLVTRERFLALVRDPAFARDVADQNGLDLGKGPASLEGYLYPETYQFNKTSTPEDIIRTMVRTFKANWESENDIRLHQLGLSQREAVILASIVEKETGLPSDRPHISSVFHNRLQRHMKLQSDPTTIYGIWNKYRAQGNNIHREDLASKTAYNTYFIPALPVGPIGNPGRESIRATLYPSQTEDLFFVSHNDGTTHFSKTLNEHNNAVQKYQVDPRAREGKSWRDAVPSPKPKSKP